MLGPRDMLFAFRLLNVPLQLRCDLVEALPESASFRDMGSKTDGAARDGTVDPGYRAVQLAHG